MSKSTGERWVNLPIPESLYNLIMLAVEYRVRQGRVKDGHFAYVPTLSEILGDYNAGQKVQLPYE